MKYFPTVMLMIALGLSVAVTAMDFGEYGLDPDTQEFAGNVLDGGFEKDEIVDMDDALEKARMLKKIAMMVEEAEASDLTKPKKRFIEGIIWNLGPMRKSILGPLKSSRCNDPWEVMKKKVNHVHNKVNFESVMFKIVDNFQAKYSDAECQEAVDKTRDSVKSPLAATLNTMSKELCSLIQVCYSIVVPGTFTKRQA